MHKIQGENGRRTGRDTRPPKCLRKIVRVINLGYTSKAHRLKYSKPLKYYNVTRHVYWTPTSRTGNTKLAYPYLILYTNPPIPLLYPRRQVNGKKNNTFRSHQSVVRCIHTDYVIDYEHWKHVASTVVLGETAPTPASLLPTKNTKVTYNERLFNASQRYYSNQL